MTFLSLPRFAKALPLLAASACTDTINTLSPNTLTAQRISTTINDQPDKGYCYQALRWDESHYCYIHPTAEDFRNPLVITSIQSGYFADNSEARYQLFEAQVASDGKLSSTQSYGYLSVTHENPGQSYTLTIPRELRGLIPTTNGKKPSSDEYQFTASEHVFIYYESVLSGITLASEERQDDMTLLRHMALVRLGLSPDSISDSPNQLPIYPIPIEWPNQISDEDRLDLIKENLDHGRRNDDVIAAVFQYVQDHQDHDDALLRLVRILKRASTERADRILEGLSLDPRISDAVKAHISRSDSN